MQFPTFEGVVLPEWIDANGHLNLAYYVVLFDQATDLMYDVIGVGQAYRDATGNSTFTAETHTLYEREVRVGERVRVSCASAWGGRQAAALLPRDVPREHGHRVAAQELLALHIDYVGAAGGAVSGRSCRADSGRRCGRGRAGAAERRRAADCVTWIDPTPNPLPHAGEGVGNGRRRHAPSPTQRGREG